MVLLEQIVDIFVVGLAYQECLFIGEPILLGSQCLLSDQNQMRTEQV